MGKMIKKGTCPIIRSIIDGDQFNVAGRKVGMGENTFNRSFRILQLIVCEHHNRDIITILLTWSSAQSLHTLHHLLSIASNPLFTGKHIRLEVPKTIGLDKEWPNLHGKNSSHLRGVMQGLINRCPYISKVQRYLRQKLRRILCALCQQICRLIQVLQ